MYEFSIYKKIKVLFVCENNQYSIFTHLNQRQPKERKIEKISLPIMLPLNP